MEHEDSLPVTETQWEEESPTWRWAHLDRAPSAYFRRLAVEDRELQERLAAGQAVGVKQHHLGWTGPPHLALEMMVAVLIVAAVVIGVAVR